MNKGLYLSFDMTGAQALSAIGCSQYMVSWKYLFLYGFDLSNNGIGNSPFRNASFQSCKVMPGSPMYYDNSGNTWKRILPEIFTVRFDQYSGIFLEVSLHVLYPRYVILYIQSCLNGRDQDKLTM